MTSGMVVGIYGSQTKDDHLKVEKIILPTLAPQIEWPIVQEDRLAY